MPKEQRKSTNHDKGNIKIGVDDTGRRFVYQFFDELNKNHRGVINNPTSVTDGRVYENPGEINN